MKPGYLIGFGALLALVISIALTTSNKPAAVTAKFKTIDGQVINFEDLRGKPVLINFWSTSCAPCIEEMPALEAFYKHNKGRLIMIGVAMPQDRPDIVVDFSQRLGVTYPIALDLNSELVTEFNVQVVPTTLLFGPQGQLFNKTLGIVDTATLQAIVNQLTGE